MRKLTEALGDIDRARRDYEHIAANHRDPPRAGLRYLGAFYARHGERGRPARVAREIQRVAQRGYPNALCCARHASVATVTPPPPSPCSPARQSKTSADASRC